MFTACTALVKFCNVTDLINQTVALGVDLKSCIILYIADWHGLKNTSQLFLPVVFDMHLDDRNKHESKVSFCFSQKKRPLYR